MQPSPPVANSAATTPQLAPDRPPDDDDPTIHISALALPASRDASIPSGPPHRDHNSLLQAEASVAPEEAYGEDERALNAFVKLHPMLSMLSTGQNVLEKIAELFPKTAVQDRPIECCSFDHDNLFLRPPHACERPCVCGTKCLANVIAQLRYGDDTPKAFVCVEHLLPSELDAFRNGKGLPRVPGKCLLCTRYTTTFLYVLSRHDPKLKLSCSMLQHQTHCNATCPPFRSDDPVADASSVPTHSSEIGGQMGYKHSCMLYVDDDFCNSSLAREERIGLLQWKPFVR